jgi:hypothetical protein
MARERGAMLHDVGTEHVYFPHTAMISLVAVMQSGATVETAAIGRAGVIVRESTSFLSAVKPVFGIVNKGRSHSYLV